LTVTDVKRESSTITSFTLSAGSGQSTGPVAPGQYLTFRLRPGGPDQPAVIRSYSLSRVTDDTYRVSLNLQPHGAGSGLMHGHVPTGDVLDVAAPRGAFILRDTDHPIVLISAGVGATPVLAMLRALAAAHSTREVWWIHGARNAQEQAFGHEVDDLLASLPNAHRLVAYSRPSNGAAPGGTFDLTGHISAETIVGARASPRPHSHL